MSINDTSAKYFGARLTGSRVVGELVTDWGARGTTAIVKAIFGGPRDAVNRFVSANIVLPNLEKIEGTIDKLIPGVETPSDREKRRIGTREERADRIAASMFDLSTDFVGGYLVQVIGQDALDRAFRLPRIGYEKQAQFALVDRAVQIGSFVALNPIGGDMNKAAQKPISGFVERLLNGVGIKTSKERADWYASQLMNVRVPNASGSLAAGLLQHHYTKHHL